MHRNSTLFLLLIGAGLFVFVRVASGEDPFLGGPLVWETQLAIGAAAALFPLVFREVSVIRIAGYLLLGWSGFSVVYLFATGPGNLWPIALFLFGLVAVYPVVLGGVLGGLFRLLRSDGERP